jgi:hypothetical protein
MNTSNYTRISICFTLMVLCLSAISQSYPIHYIEETPSINGHAQDSLEYNILHIPYERQLQSLGDPVLHPWQ